MESEAGVRARRPDRENDEALRQVLASYPSVLVFFRSRIGVRGGDHVEDLAQETILAALQGVARGTAIGSVPRYVLRIARNKLCDWLNRSYRRGRGTAPIESMIGSRAVDLMQQAIADARLVEQEQRRRIAAAIRRLSRRERTLLVLRYREALTNEQAARRMGLEPAQASRLKYRALARLREVFDGIGPNGADLR